MSSKPPKDYSLLKIGYQPIQNKNSSLSFHTLLLLEKIKIQSQDLEKLKLKGKP